MNPQPRLVLLARTSTDDQQSPEDSLRWQHSRAQTLVAGRAEIVRVVHDRDVSRAVPWSRRPEASKLLAELRDPLRDWDGIVVGEPQRAFGTAAQVQLVLSQLAEHGVTLWVPEVGGPVDPESEAHDILLSLFGGLSRAERNRLRVRVREAMRTMAKAGERFLGGRPPYGYRLVPSDVPHPNPEKARHGICLTRLEIDPETAVAVRQIFEWRLDGVGFRTIALRLDEAGIPSPSAADPARNPHRHGCGWAVSAVRAIVLNPRYMGTGRFGAYRKVERLYDPDDPAAGTVTRMAKAHADDVIEVPGAVPAVVDEDTWRRAQPAHAPTAWPPRTPVRPGPRPDRRQTRYALRGILRCDACGRLMQGHMVRRRSGSVRIGYRCVARAAYPGQRDHPPSLYVAEDRLVGVLDPWLATLTDPGHLDESVAAIVAADAERTAEPPEVRRARHEAADARSRLERLMQALEAGLDPDLAVARVRRAQRDLARAESVLSARDGGAAPALSDQRVRQLLEELGGLRGLLRDADAHERHRLYDAAGLRLRYRRDEAGREALVTALAVSKSRVGGGA